MVLVIRSLLLIFAVAVFGALVACSPSHSDLKTQVAQAVQTEKSAKTLSEYESSENHPDVLFAELAPDQSQKICDELTSLEIKELLVFEEQIDNKANKTILAPCLEELKTKIDQFYLDERKKISHPLILVPRTQNPEAEYVGTLEPVGGSFHSQSEETPVLETSPVPEKTPAPKVEPSKPTPAPKVAPSLPAALAHKQEPAKPAPALKVAPAPAPAVPKLEPKVEPKTSENKVTPKVTPKLEKPAQPTQAPVQNKPAPTAPAKPILAEPVVLPRNSTNNFRFPDDVQYRDVSHGYTAYRGDLRRKEVVLTFDDGPHPEYTQSIVRSLSEVNAKAIFFELGKNVHSYPNMTRLIAKAGMGIGAHSMTHACIAQSAVCDAHNARSHMNGSHGFTEAESMAEIQGSLQAVYDVLGWVSPFFRFPYGESSPNLANILKQNGVANFLWSIDSEDWKVHSTSELIQGVFEQVDRNQGGIILFHDIQRKTAEALPEILNQLYAKGYSVVFLQPQGTNARFQNGLVSASATPRLAKVNARPKP